VDAAKGKNTTTGRGVLLIGAAKKPELLRAAKKAWLSNQAALSVLTCVSRPGASALAERALAVHTVVVARPAVHKQWLGEGVVIGRGAKTAAAEAFTDSLEHGGRDIQVDLNVSLGWSMQRRI